jgi:hypothetical protein
VIETYQILCLAVVSGSQQKDPEEMDFDGGSTALERKVWSKEGYCPANGKEQYEGTTHQGNHDKIEKGFQGVVTDPTS